MPKIFSDLRPLLAAATGAATGAAAGLAGAAATALAGAAGFAFDLFSRLVITTAIISWLDSGLVAPVEKSPTLDQLSLIDSGVRFATSYW